MADTKKGKGLPQTLTLDHVSPATRLLEKRRQMFEVQEALNAQKEDFARREEAFRRREEGLRQKDLELQESLIKFNKFLQENESKRNRAEKRTRDENRQANDKEKEIQERTIEYEVMKLECEKVKASIHETILNSDGVIKMKKLERFVVEAESNLNFMPGGKHVMFSGLKEFKESILVCTFSSNTGIEIPFTFEVLKNGR